MTLGSCARLDGESGDHSPIGDVVSWLNARTA